MVLNSDESQIHVPPSFVALYSDARRQRLSVSVDTVRARHELCEDLAQLLVEPAQAQSHGGIVSDAEVLARCHAGLLQPDAPLSEAEAGWVIGRLAELLDWPLPEGMLPPPG